MLFRGAGAGVTLCILLAGFGSFLSGNTRASQLLMRARVVAQTATIVAVCGAAFTAVAPNSDKLPPSDSRE